MDYSPSDSFPHLFCSGNDVKSFFSFILLTILLQLLFLLFKLTPFRFLCLWTWNLDETWMIWSFLLHGKQNTITYSLLICFKILTILLPWLHLSLLREFPIIWGLLRELPRAILSSSLKLFPVVVKSFSITFEFISCCIKLLSLASVMWFERMLSRFT